MRFKTHPDSSMGIQIVDDDSAINTTGEKELAFPLTDDERSVAYLAWIAEGNTTESVVE